MAAERSAAALRRFVLVAVILPVCLTAAAVIVQVVALPALPDPAAVHWGASGSADGFASPWLYPVLTLVVAGALPLLLALTSLPGLRRGGGGPTYRFMGALALGLAAFSAVVLTWSALMQAGLADAVDAPSVWPALIGGIVAGGVAGSIGWLVQPRVEQPAPSVLPGAAIALRPGERAVWMRTTTIGRAGGFGIGVGTIAVVLAAVITAVTGAPAATVWVLGVAAVVLVALAATTVAFHVRVDEAGLEVRSVLGLPRFRVPLAEVARAAGVEVNPMGEFGGWGIRTTPGRFGIVLRTGPAFEVWRENGRRTVVTVDDAATGAALLQALADRARHGAAAHRG